MKIWFCKIGECDAALLADDGADAPMRQAVERAYREATGLDNAFCFSGWGAALDEGERAVVERREPSEEYHREWLMREAALDLYEALQEVSRAMTKLTFEGIDRGKGHWPAWDDTARAVDKARAALAKVSPQSRPPHAREAGGK